jgi:hypothetical protein
MIELTALNSRPISKWTAKLIWLLFPMTVKR